MAAESRPSRVAVSGALAVIEVILYVAAAVILIFAAFGVSLSGDPWKLAVGLAMLGYGLGRV